MLAPGREMRTASGLLRYLEFPGFDNLPGLISQMVDIDTTIVGAEIDSCFFA